MNYLLGFDCGATKIECILADDHGIHLFNLKKLLPSNLLIDGVENVTRNILSVMDESISSYNFPEKLVQFEAIVIGAAGAGRKHDADALQASLKNNLAGSVNYHTLAVVSDATVTLAAAFPGKPGCILIAGTGSIVYGKDKSGTLFRAGGFGRIIGDGGSGYSIGEKALGIAAKDFDEAIHSSFIKLLGDKYSINSPDELITEVYKKEFDIASLARHIIILAESGDETSVQILNEESDELILLINSMMRKLNVNKIDIALSGSLIDNDNYYSRMLKDKITKQLKSVKIIDTKIKPVVGAITIAKGLAGG